MVCCCVKKEETKRLESENKQLAGKGKEENDRMKRKKRRRKKKEKEEKEKEKEGGKKEKEVLGGRSTERKRHVERCGGKRSNFSQFRMAECGWDDLLDGLNDLPPSVSSLITEDLKVLPLHSLFHTTCVFSF